MTILLILLCLLIGFFYIELYLCKMWRKKIKCLVHVNGIRGKSTVTRMLDSAIKENNFRSMAKTTGSEPAYILPDGAIKLIKRKAPANIREQVRMLRLASKNNCDYYIVECMAVNPILQRYCEMLLRADVTIITNVKMDHIGVLGFNKEEVGESLLKSQPDNGILVTDDYYSKTSENHKFVKKYYSKNDVFSENANTALTVCDLLGLELEKCKIGINKYSLDIGHREVYNINGGIFINGFSANDYESTCGILNRYSDYNNLELSFLYNNRSDRQYRFLLMLDLINRYNPKILYISGEAILYMKYKIRKSGFCGDIRIIKSSDDIDFNNCVTIGIGNIKGMPIEMLKEMEMKC